jgi:hypothetical protein
VLSSKPIPGRGEPAYLARNLRDAEAELEQAQNEIVTVGPRTAAQ